MKTIYSVIIIFTLLFNAYGHSDSYLSYQYGQVLVSIKTGNYNRVQEDVKLLGQLLDKVCKELNFTDTIHIDFIHNYGCIDCESYYMFSKTEPFGYYVRYNGNDDFELRQANHSDSLNVSSIKSTIRIIGSNLDLRKALQEATLFLYHQDNLDSTDFNDRFSGREVYKSVFSNPNSRFYGHKENKRLFQLTDKVLSEKSWLHYPDPDVDFAYYFQDSVYYIVSKKDSSLIDSAKKIYCLSEAFDDFGASTLFVFKNPFEFSVTHYSYDYFFFDSLYIHTRTNQRILNLLESDIGLNGNWYIKWIYGDVYLLDHSYFLIGSEGPFVLYDNSKKEIILTQKR